MPWRPWSTRERLDVGTDDAGPACFDDISALVPARNEAMLIEETLHALGAQGAGLRVVVIDDQSDDDTAARARAAGAVEVIASAPLPEGWTRQVVGARAGLARDADALSSCWSTPTSCSRRAALHALRAQAGRSGAELASLVAEPRLRSFWERLLLPAFVYFFKLLYPFRLSNAGCRASPPPREAASSSSVAYSSGSAASGR